MEELYAHLFQIVKAIKSLPDKVRQTLELNDRLLSLAQYFKEKLPNGPFLVIGRGYSYATCLEGALKIKELTYIASEGNTCVDRVCLFLAFYPFDR